VPPVGVLRGNDLRNLSRIYLMASVFRPRTSVHQSPSSWGQGRPGAMAWLDPNQPSCAANRPESEKRGRGKL